MPPFGSLWAEQLNRTDFIFDQLVEPFINMCKELQTNIYIANNKYTIQNNIPLQISHWGENVCSDSVFFLEANVRYVALWAVISA